LALGIEGRREIVDLELAVPMEASEVLNRLRASAPSGFDWLMAESVGPGRSAQAGVVHYLLDDVPADRQPDALTSLAKFLAGTSWPYTRHRPDRDVAIDLRPFVLGAELDPSGALRFQMKINPSGSARPEEFVEALGLRDLLGQGSILIRTEMELVS
jgi:radical SAM-linked protein